MTKDEDIKCKERISELLTENIELKYAIYKKQTN
jgi:hypothetical protein